MTTRSARAGAALGSLRALCLAVAALACLALPVRAHGTRTGPAAGVAIPSLTHGQMRVLNPFSREILALADRHAQTGEAFRRVLNYARLQRFYCGWGLMPGSVSDEASPFNECSHATLAATRDLLVRLSAAAPRDAAVNALAGRVERAMLESGMALELCRFSAESFDTAALVRPDWRRVPFHAPSLLALLLVAAAAAAASVLLASGWRRLMRPEGGLRAPALP